MMACHLSAINAPLNLRILQQCGKVTRVGTRLFSTASNKMERWSDFTVLAYHETGNFGE